MIWFILPGRICGKEVSEEPIEGLVNTNLNPYPSRMASDTGTKRVRRWGVLVHSRVSNPY